MAVSTVSPYPSPSVPSDLVSLKEASALFDECGPGRQVSKNTLRKWAVKHGVPLRRVRGEDVASWSDLLDVHAKEIDRREAGRARP